MHLPRELTLCCLLVLAHLLALPATAAIIDVPGDAATVRAAVNAAANGDTILIAPGTHPGGVFVSNKSLTVASHYLVTGDTALVAQTVLSGVASGMCSGHSGCTGGAVLEFGANAHGSRILGLTLTNGENGLIATSIVDLDHCRVVANGDGVDYYEGAGGTISNSVFENNTDDGIDLNGRMNISIHHNLVRNNNDDGLEFRLYAFTGPEVTVDIFRNRFTGNGEDGIQIIDYPVVSGYVIRIDRNFFAGNFDASGNSAAIGVMPNGETVENLVGAPAAERIYVTNNTMMGEKNGLVGGANVVALNNIFADIPGKALRRVGGNSITSYCMFWNNGVNHETSVIDSSHILVANPALDPTGDLPAGSPAIDAGTVSFQWMGETVLSIPGSEYAGSAPDVGADEFGWSPPGFNLAPTVSAGSDQSVQFPDGVALAGSASDDGNPNPPALLKRHWSVVSGAGPMVIEDASEAVTRAYFSKPGIYHLRLTASDGQVMSADTVRISVLTGPNAAPVVDAGPNRSITLPAGATLDGTVSDDGLPNPPGVLTTTWSVGSGPGGVTFANANAVDTQASFSVAGSYLLRLTATDGAFVRIDSMQVTVAPIPNAPPVVDAGPSRVITLPASASLDGTVSDDALPNPPAAVTTTWSVGSGPGAVTFTNANAVDTQASFTVAGTYILRLTGNDGALSAIDSMQVTVAPDPNLAPVVNAGLDQTIILPASAALNGTVSDDGLPAPPALTTTWSVFSGPGPVTFQNANLVDTQASFTTAGVYVLRLTANDSRLGTFDHVQITVQAVAAPLERRVTASSDDAEEGASGVMNLNSTNLDLVFNGTNQTVGLRFTSLAIPAGATITRAYVQFTARKVDHGASSMTLRGQTADNPGTFTGTAGNLGGRSRTTASVSWVPPDWNKIGDALADERTPELKNIVQEIVSRPGWASGNALVIILTGTGTRTASAYDAATSEAPLLHIEYATAGAPQMSMREAPVVETREESPRFDFALHRVGPNPARGELWVDFSLADAGTASLELVDIAGRRVATREVGSFGPGRHRIELREPLPTGVYLVRLAQGRSVRVKKVAVLK